MNSVGSWSSLHMDHGIACTTGGLPYIDMGALGRTGWECEETEYPFIWKSSRDVWSSALGWVINQLRACPWGLVGRATWVMLSWLSAANYLIKKKINETFFRLILKEPHVCRLWFSWRTWTTPVSAGVQHSWAQAIQEVSGVHWQQCPDTGDQGVNKDRCSAGPYVYKQWRLVWRCEGWSNHTTCSNHGMVKFRVLERTGKEKKNYHSAGLQEIRLLPVHGSAWKNILGHSPGEQRSPGELIGPSPSSRKVRPDKQEIKQRQQEACMSKSSMYRRWKQGQATQKQYKDGV